MKKVVLPVRARDPKRIVKRLEPVLHGTLYMLEVCEGLSCKICVFHEKPKIIIKKYIITDPLSSLKMKLPVVKAEYCKQIIWETEWKNGMLVVSGIQCPTLEDNCLYINKEKYCNSRVEEILLSRCRVSDAGRSHNPP